jgi:hypothetical protein
MVGVGSWSASGNDFSASGKLVGVELGQLSDNSSLSMSGIFRAGYRMMGDYEVEDSDKGTYDLFALPALHRKAVSLADIAGTYRVKTQVTGAAGTLTLSQSGDLSGSDSYGCGYAGQITFPDPQFNLLEFSMTVSGCGSWNGTYRGYGAQVDLQEPDDKRVLRLIGKHNRFPALIDLQN